MKIKSKSLTLLLLAIVLCGCSRQSARPSAEQCQAIEKKAEAKRLYDEIEQTDMAVFDTVGDRDPHVVEYRLLHGYLTLDNYASAHNTTLSRLTFMERRQILLDDAVKNEGASPTGLTPDESSVLRKCKEFQ